MGIALATLFGASVVIFSLVHLAPMEPARFFVQFRQGGGRGEEQMRAVRAWYGLDDPKPVQYVRWMSRVARGDLGRSVGSGREVGPEIARRIPWSLLLAGVSFGLAWVLAVPLAVAGARGGAVGRAADGVITAGLLVPVFLLASVLIYVFAVRLTWIPILPPFELNLLDSYLWRALILPGLSVALPLAAVVAREIRAGLRAGLATAQATAARARGATERRVLLAAVAVAARSILAHALPMVSLLFGAILIVEEIFGWPGMARVLVRGIVQRDITVMQGSLLALVALVVAAELVMRLAVGRRALGSDAAAADGAVGKAPVAGRPRTPGIPAPIPRPSVGARVAMGVAALLAVAAIAAPLLGRFPPDLVLLEEIQLGPSLRHWMGTDASGRDLFSRLLHAGRTTLGLALASSLAAVAAAAALAALAVGRGRWAATWRDAGAGLGRTVHAIPAFAFALAIVSIAGRAPVIMVTIFAACGMATVYPSLRALAANAAAWGFVSAGQAAGGSGLRIAERHLLPHLARPLLAAALGLVPAMLMLEATLGFFGFSVTPTIPTWGTMLWRGREALHRGDWWLLAFPVAFVAASSWGFGGVAESLRHPAPPTYVRSSRLVLGQEWGAAARGAVRPTAPPLPIRRAAAPITRPAEAGGSVEGGASEGASG